MAKFKTYRKNQLHFLPNNLNDYVPQGHPARVVYEIVEGLDTSAIENKYSSLGQNTYHPKVLLKLLFYGYASGVRSGRKLAARCESDTAYMYLAEMYRPDFRTINDFRKNHLTQIEECFIQVVRICRELGIARMGKIFLDGSKMKANASSKRSKKKQSYERWLQKVQQDIQAILKEAQQIDAAEDELYGDSRGDEIPAKLHSKQALVGKIKQALSQFETEESYKINLTDPDSRFMGKRQGPTTLGYNCQLSVAEGQVIVAADVVAESNDRQQLVPMLERTEKVSGEKVTEAIADCGYSSYDNYEYLESKGKRGYIPDPSLTRLQANDFKLPEHRYHKENFRYDKEQDIYICPEGKELRLWRERDKKRGKSTHKERLYKGNDCKNCPAIACCTKGRYRTITREEREVLQEAMRRRLLSKEGQEKYKRRLHTVEPVFGHFKHNLGYRHFLLRGLEKVKGEFSLMCIGYNLKKIFRYKAALVC